MKTTTKYYIYYKFPETDAENDNGQIIWFNQQQESDDGIQFVFATEERESLPDALERMREPILEIVTKVELDDALARANAET